MPLVRLACTMFWNVVIVLKVPQSKYPQVIIYLNFAGKKPPTHQFTFSIWCAVNKTWVFYFVFNNNDSLVSVISSSLCLKRLCQHDKAVTMVTFHKLNEQCCSVTVVRRGNKISQWYFNFFRWKRMVDLVFEKLCL